MRAKRKRAEQAIQQEVAKLLRLANVPPSRWTAIERANSKMLGGIQWSMGCNAGWPDMIFLLDEGTIAAIEFKRAKFGRLSPEQEVWRRMAETMNIRWALCTSVEGAFAHLRNWRFPGAERIHFTSTGAPVIASAA